MAEYMKSISKTVIVVGGDGFCGWPLSLRLSNKGYTVIIVDNLSKRKIDVELGNASLTKISTIQERLKAWKQVSNKTIIWHDINVAKEYDEFVKILQQYKPETIVHLGEQRAAPYSMKSSKTSRYTVDNNLNGTHNILAAIVEVDVNIHLVHLGTMGVYGYGAVSDVLIPEGYVDVKMKDKYGNDKPIKIVHPAYPGSIYHMTKTQDALFFQFYNKNWKIKITDLHQGIVWGLYTTETQMDPRLINRFDYDGDYGTVLNRFIMQAANDIPLTVYGTGEQTRAFIHIENSMECIELAIKNPQSTGKVKIFNQTTETIRLLDLAQMITNKFKGKKVQYLKNPRKELVSNTLEVENKQFLELGMKPIKVDSARLEEIYTFIRKHSKNVNTQIILPSSKW
eukprot:171568_1